MAHTFTNLLAHVIFSTKDRQPTITTELQTRLHAYMGGIIRTLDGSLYVLVGRWTMFTFLSNNPPRSRWRT